jgi:hypothetical protein
MGTGKVLEHRHSAGALAGGWRPASACVPMWCVAVVAVHVLAPPGRRACRCGENYTHWPTPYQTPRVAGP